MTEDLSRYATHCSNTAVKNYRQPIYWVWDGVIALNAITLISAPEKSGKTTLLSLLLDRRREGGMLLGREVHPGRTILCSEEDDLLWSLRQPPLDFGSQLEYHRPISIEGTFEEWRNYVDYLLELGHDSYDLFVIDTVMSFLPASQNSARAMLRALEELRVVCGKMVGVLLIHQSNTARNRTRARGPLTSFADILIDMSIPGNDRFTRRRCFNGVGRYPGTPQRVVADLNPEGTDYVLLPDDVLQMAAGPSLEVVRQIIAASAGPLTRQEILDRWPEGEPLPRPDTLWRTLNRACEQGALIRTGSGTKNEAFRYQFQQPEE
jgi:hypothetical protein